jgi:hypothetical protein
LGNNIALWEMMGKKNSSRRLWEEQSNSDDEKGKKEPLESLGKGEIVNNGDLRAEVQ